MRRRRRGRHTMTRVAPHFFLHAKRKFLDSKWLSAADRRAFAQNIESKELTGKILEIKGLADV